MSEIWYQDYFQKKSKSKKMVLETNLNLFPKIKKLHKKSADNIIEPPGHVMKSISDGVF